MSIDPLPIRLVPVARPWRRSLTGLVVVVVVAAEIAEAAAAVHSFLVRNRLLGVVAAAVEGDKRPRAPVPEQTWIAAMPSVARGQRLVLPLRWKRRQHYESECSRGQQCNSSHNSHPLPSPFNSRAALPTALHETVQRVHKVLCPIRRDGCRTGAKRVRRRLATEESR